METTEARSRDSTTEQRRELAIKRLKAKSDFKKQLLAYVAVNTMLTVIWASPVPGSRGRGASSGRYSPSSGEVSGW